jgi:predicted Zn-dependent protease
MTPLVRRGHFDALADAVCAPGDRLDRVTLQLRAESSDFIRFNRGAVRQLTHVDQGFATLAVVRGRRRIECRIALTGRLDADVATLIAERRLLAGALAEVADDPYLLMPEVASHSARHDSGTLPDPAAVVDAVVRSAAGLDFVGFHAAGPVVRAFADSLGTRHWHHVESFHVDWCLYHSADRAVKSSYAGTRWHEPEFGRRIAAAAQRLDLLGRPPRRVEPGPHRAYFAPAAMGELLGMLGWGGFGLKARRTGTSCLMRLAHRDTQLDPRITIAEDTAHGIAPAFTTDGFLRPPAIPLVADGLAADTLNAARSAREYGLPANGANAQEVPESLSLAPGTLAESDALATLGTGLLVSNLWYLNFSDRPACRITGMTRFACLWVENGEPVAPIGVMRFDDSFLRMFGAGLVALTDRAELIPESGTYQERQLSSVSTPGAIVEGWRLVL